ncbi:hypothetical protein AWQ24_11040 [Picosynechococcus sp. PCC 8807]|nr:hypothetical protein AWQ24_11040 [Picosynechococcus sp. PCC 8807]
MLGINYPLIADEYRYFHEELEKRFRSFVEEIMKILASASQKQKNLKYLTKKPLIRYERRFIHEFLYEIFLITDFPKEKIQFD